MNHKVSILLLFCALRMNAQDTIFKMQYVRKGDTVFYNSVKFTGTAIKKADNGRIVALENFKAGMANGIWKEWYKTGELKFEGAFVDGKNAGVWTQWNSDGTIQRRITFKNNTAVEDKHPEITLKTEAIDNDSSLRKVILENEEFMSRMSDGGGELTGYFKGNDAKKIVSWIGVSNGIVIHSFYLDSGRLIYVNETFEMFIFNDSNTALLMDTDKTDTTFRGHYYFRNNKLIDMETIGHNRFEDDTLDVEKELIADMKGYLEMLRRKKK